MKRHAAQWFRTGILATLALALAGSLPAQDPIQQQNPPQPVQTLTAQQLDNLVAPVALYPDPLLGQVLAAATYPVELVEAQQWLKTVGNLNGQALMDAAKQQNWDPSVQALVAMPDVMNLLTQDVQWTTDLGNAFLAQQGDVMSAVQRMRQRAQANGQLQSNAQQTVSTDTDNGQSAIEIEPANPQVIYVPTYDPYYVYGWGAYPPLYYPDGYFFDSGIDIGFYFGGWGGWGYGGWGWGWRPNWFGRNIYVNNVFFNRYGYHYHDFGGGRNVWMHDPGHRWGAGYPAGVAGRFGGAERTARINEGRSGNWHTFGGGGNAYRGTGNGFNGSRFNGSGGVNGNRGGAGGGNSFRGGAGNSFRGSGNAGAAQQRASAGTQAFRGQNIRSQSQQRSFQSAPQRSFQSGQQRSFQSAPQRGFQSGQQRSFQSAPQRSFQSAPQRSFQSAPQRSFQSAPMRSFQPAPRMSAPSAAPRSFGGARSFGGGSFGGGARSFGGGGGARNMGGGGRSFGGGGRSFGGGGHGGRR